MLSATRRTRRILDGPCPSDVQKYAAHHSADSFNRFIEQANLHYINAGCAVEYDGKIIRCICKDTKRFLDLAARHENTLRPIDPLCRGEADYILSSIIDDVLWWYDVPSFETRFVNVKNNVIPTTKDRAAHLESVPVVVGADWEFNAWACPARPVGDFIMVNLGFMFAHCFAAMYFLMIEECREAAEKGQANGIITSSMLWWAAKAMGYDRYQWSNLTLPWSEDSRVWCAVQQPTERARQAMVALDGFAMLHECGHVSCGHLNRLREWVPEETLTASERHDRYAEMRTFEFEADKFACDAILTRGPAALAWFDALHIMFLMISICEGARSTASLLTSTHPTAKDRLCKCVSLLGQDGESAVRYLELCTSAIVDTARRRVEWQERRE